MKKIDRIRNLFTYLPPDVELSARRISMIIGCWFPSSVYVPLALLTQEGFLKSRFAEAPGPVEYVIPRRYVYSRKA